MARHENTCTACLPGALSAETGDLAVRIHFVVLENSQLDLHHPQLSTGDQTRGDGFEEGRVMGYTRPIDENEPEESRVDGRSEGEEGRNQNRRKERINKRREDQRDARNNETDR